MAIFGTSGIALFLLGATAVVVFGWYLILEGIVYAKRVQSARKNNVLIPSPIPLVLRILLASVAFLVAEAVLWNTYVGGVATTAIGYENEAQHQEDKAVKESQLPSVSEMDQVRAQQKERAEAGRHKEALENYSSAMKKEAEKIRQRSLSTTVESVTPEGQ